MAKLIFRYGAMGSSKTANALMVRYNYLEKGYVPYLLKPATDTRAAAATDTTTATDIIDEAQFLRPEEVEAFAHIVDEREITVICYGLMTDFQSRLFPGSQRLCELADRLEEIPTLCWCGKKAHFNTRFSDGKIVRTGAQVMLGGNESYVALCRKHYFEGRLHGDRPHEDLTQDIAGV